MKPAYARTDILREREKSVLVMGEGDNMKERPPNRANCMPEREGGGRVFRR